MVMRSLRAQPRARAIPRHPRTPRTATRRREARLDVVRPYVSIERKHSAGEAQPASLTSSSAACCHDTRFWD